MTFGWRWVAHAVGVLGMAWALAVWSHAYAEARHSGDPVAARLRALPYAPMLEGAALLGFLSLALTDGRVWARLWWGLCIGVMLWQLVQRALPEKLKKSEP